MVASFMVKGSERLGCPPLPRKMDIAGLMGGHMKFMEVLRKEEQNQAC